MKVLAIDPGERVGWAHGVIEDRVRLGGPPLRGFQQESGVLPEATIQTETFKALEVTGHGITALKPFALKLARVIHDYDVVVYERWALAAGMAKQLAGSEMATSQLIGVIRYLSWVTPGVTLIGQWPAEMKTARKTLPPEIEGIIEMLPAAHDDSHDESALLHLWRYYQKRYLR